MVFDFNVAKPVHEVWCRIILQRYLGKYLDRKLELEQLTVNLVKGKIEINNLSLHVTTVNELLESVNCPLRLLDGYIGTIVIDVPWTNLMGAGSSMNIVDLQLTFKAVDLIKVDERDLVASMVESVMNSIVSSGDVARNIFEEAKHDPAADQLDGEESLDSFTKIIDAIYARFRVEIDKVTIRIENPPVNGSNLYTAIELRGKKVEFMDEQMRACQQDDKSADAITSQPHGIGSIANLNKTLSIKGVSLYTDVFSSIPDVEYGAEANCEQKLITSMHIRREKEKLSPSRSPQLSVHPEMYTSAMSNMTAFHSCYNTLANDYPESFSPTNLEPLKQQPSEPELYSNPVKFAEIVGEALIVFRFKNTGNGVDDENKVEAEVTLKGANVFITPSQLVILNRFISSVAIPKSTENKELGKPMKPEDYENIVKTIETENVTISRPPHSGLGGGGNWQQADDFREFESINLDEKKSRRSVDSEFGTIKVNGKEEINIKASIGTLIIVITHEDILSVDSVQERGSFEQAIDNLHSASTYFFAHAETLRPSPQMNLADFRQAADVLYPNDHIRIVASSLVSTYSMTKTSNKEHMVAKFIITNFDILEYLTRESVPGASKALRVPLLDFSEDKHSDMGCNMKLFITASSDDKQKLSVDMYIGQCTTELDLSMVDRIASLIVTKPYFDKKDESKRVDDPPPQLNENLFAATVAIEEPKSHTKFTMNCTKWTVDLRIPMADLRDPSGSRIPFAQRNVHPEFVRINLVDATLTIPTTSHSYLSKVNLKCEQITGDFCGEGLDIAEKQRRFIYGTKLGADDVKIQMTFDLRTKRVVLAKPEKPSLPPDDLNKSFSSPLMMSHPKEEGPFSQIPRSYCTVEPGEDENIIQAGTREEIKAFEKKCGEFSATYIHFKVPTLRVHIPTQGPLEVLYNRLVNDLALWQPAAPGLRPENDSLKVNAFDTFHECAAENEDSDIDSDDETDLTRTTIEAKDEYDRSIPHFFSASMDVCRAVLVCNTVAKKTKAESTPGQVAIEMESLKVGTTCGYHGDMNHTFFYLTATKTTAGVSSDEHHVESDITSYMFGRYKKEFTQMEPLPYEDEHFSGAKDDSLAIALHMHARPEINVKDVLLAINLRASIIHVKPVPDHGLLWVSQLAELFTLRDYSIPGYELPEVTTDFHMCLENSIAYYDHKHVNPKSTLKVRGVFGLVNLSCSFLPEVNISKTLCIMERARLYLTNAESIKETVRFKKEEVEKPKSFIPIMDIGQVQLDFLFCPTGENAGEKRHTPVFEIRCRNDIIQAWACADSLAALISIATEILQSDTCFGNRHEDPANAMQNSSGSKASDASTVHNPKKYSAGSQLPEEVQKRLQDLIEDAIIDRDTIGTAVGIDAVEEFSANYRPDETPTHAPRVRDYSLNGDDEFCMVDNDVIGSGITDTAGEPRVRYFNDDGNVTDNDEVEMDLNFQKQPEEWTNDILQQTVQQEEKPLVRYLFKDISLRIHLYGGSDLSKQRPTIKSYSTDEYREGFGRGQNVPELAYGGMYRDHSASVVLELSKITFLKQIFSKNVNIMATTSFSIYDIVIRDKVYASSINEMLYQYATSEMPRRTNAPMVSFKISETKTREGKMRVSLLPIKINVDQDTLEFLTDFFDEISKSIKLRSDATPSLSQNRPIIEIPANVHNPKKAPLSSKGSKIFQNLSQPKLNLEPLKPQPVEPMSPLGDLSYLERRGSKLPSSPLMFPMMDAPLTASVHSIGNMFESPQPPPSPDPSASSSSPEFEKADISSEMEGDWSDEYNINFNTLNNAYPPTTSGQPNDILTRSTMTGSIHPAMVNDLVDTSSDIEDQGRILDSRDEEPPNGEESRSSTPEFGRSIQACASTREVVDEDDLHRGDTFFKEFVFSPSVNIYLDYQGKRKISVEKSGALLGFLMAFGQLNQMPITLRELENRNGMLGMSRCFSYALQEWNNDLLSNMPSVLASCGPISPFVQIGKGIMDLVWMPMEEMRKEDGHVVKGIQKGVGSFGMSSAAGIVGMAQTVTGFVQSIAEMTLREVKPDDMALNRRNRRAHQQYQMNPTDLKHSFQMCYGILYDGIRQTRDDLELAAQEDRASGNSVVRSAFRYAVPTFLGPVVMATQVTYQLLGGLRNQLHPDAYQDERRKWGDHNVPGGISHR
ncbi:unnamed protein product [Caenorhabditis bovis]|uniref:Autophagy-related protein 2 n=1 Tax=Caenorhabditis bovis TaxID=2654633 RepID=A0A8S1FB06_9PELO|nr:unnamed protein product [Caenorhabditis bovis]